MQRMLPAKFTVFAEFNAVRVVLLAFHAVVISLLALSTCKCHFHPHVTFPPFNQNLELCLKLFKITIFIKPLE